MFELTNKKAIVTGGAGMGSTIGRYLMMQGADVVLVDKNFEKLEQVTDLLTKTIDKKAYAIHCDVMNYEETSKMVDTAVKLLGKIDILVNVVGGGFRKMFIDYSEQDWDYIINLNLKTTFNCIHAAAKQIIKQGTGCSIINISSAAAWTPNNTMSAYCAAKHALTGLTKTLMQELAPYNIRINNVEPGFIETEYARVLSPDYDRLIPIRANLSALNRIGKVEDVATAVVYLASDESNYITGQSLRVDGGMGIKTPHS